MAAPKTGLELFELLAKSQLLNKSVLEQLRPQIEKYVAEPPLRLAKLLIKNSLVTEHQAKNLLAGKHRGFYVGKYKLLELLGIGGMGKVFLAEQVSMERLVALKVITPPKRKGREKEALARFRREAKAVAALNHPNIVHAYDYDDVQGSPFIVMEYIEGIDVATLVGKQGALGYAQAADIMMQAAAGLQKAHKAGMVHRDIKPGNLLVDSEGNVRILDLGLCAVRDSDQDSLTIDQNQLGTVDYIAPEQAVNSHKVDARADLYSLGATFYSILRGNIMFPGYSSMQKLLAHQNEEPKSICELVPSVPKELGALIHRLLAKNPDQRIQSAEVVQRELKKWAKRSQPPYDLNLIKHKRSTFEPYIGKAPDPAEITAGSPDKAVTDEATPAASSSSQSMVGWNHSSMGQDPFPAEGFEQDPAMTTFELPAPRKKKNSKKKSKQSSNTPVLVWIGAGLAAVIMLATVIIQNTVLSVEEPQLSGGQSTSTYVAPIQPTPPPASTNRTITGNFQPASLASVATVVSTQPLFNDSNIDRLEFQDWRPKDFQGIPFTLVDPSMNRKNVILLHGSEGLHPPQMPKSVRLPCNQRLVALHLLGGISGWGYPVKSEYTETMKVRLHFDYGDPEEHALINGKHIADYIRRVDVPDSEFAFNLKGNQQVRYLRIVPRREGTVKEVEFLKIAEDHTAPIIMAVTYEIAK